MRDGYNRDGLDGRDGRDGGAGAAWGGARAGEMAIPLDHLVADALPAERLAFIQKVYLLFLASLGSAAAGVLLALTSQAVMITVMKAFLPLIIVWFVGVFLVRAVQNVPVVNVAALWAWTFLGGLTLAPAIAAYAGALGVQVVLQALTITSLAFGSCTAYVFITKKDFSWMRGALVAGILVVIGVGLLSIFWPLGHAAGTLYAGAGALLFCGFILFDTSRILHHFPVTAYIPATIALYLDFVNLFLFILRLLGSRRR